MLPSHLPVESLPVLIRDYCALTINQSDEYTPLDLLTGYYEDGEYGGMPIGNPESEEPDPMKRLSAGERLAIQLHVGMIEDGADFIDGQPYVASAAEVTENENASHSPNAFPDETGFYGLGVWLDGDRLAIEPIHVSGGFDGEICVSPVVFPTSFATRTATYLRRIAGG